MPSEVHRIVQNTQHVDGPIGLTADPEHYEMPSTTSDMQRMQTRTNFLALSRPSDGWTALQTGQRLG